jgi:hypothetical protein
MPDEFEFRFAGDIATSFLDMYLREQFAAMGLQVTFFLPRELGFNSNPISMDYNIDVYFDPSSTFVPTTAELDALIEMAFMQPAVQKLLDTYPTLPPDLPFTMTESITYSPQPQIIVDDDLATREGTKNGEVKTLSPSNKAWIAGSVALILVGVSLLSVRYKLDASTRRTKRSHSKFDKHPVMPSYSYCDTRRSNLMHFKDESTASSGASYQFSVLSKGSWATDASQKQSAGSGSSISSHSSSVNIRAV